MKRIYILFGLDMLCVALFSVIFQRHGLQLGASYSFMGFVISATAMLSVIWKPLVGNLTDHVGSKSVLVSVCAIHAVGIICTILAPNKWLFLLARMGCSVSSTTQTILRRVVMDLVGKNNSAEVFNKVGAFFGLAFIFGSLIGGQLAELKNGLIYGYSIMFFLTIASIIIGITLPNIDKIEDGMDKTATQESKKDILFAFKHLKQIAVSDRYWDLFALKAARDACHGFSINVLRIVAVDINGYSESQMSYLLVSLLISSIITSLSQTKLKSKYYPLDDGSQRVKHMTILGTIVLLVTSVAPFTMIFTMQLHSLANVTFECTLMEMLLRRIEDSEKGLVISSYETIFSVVDTIVPTLSGLLIDTFGAKVPLLACSLSYFIGYWLVTRKTSIKKLD